jgi:hypothetical protein
MTHPPGYQKRRYHFFRSRGICVSCPEPTTDGHYLCEKHLARSRELGRVRYQKNREKEKLRKAIAYRKNRIQFLARNKRWKLKSRDKMRLSERNRRETNINARVSSNLRTRIYLALRKNWKSGRTISLLGCSIDSFKIYLESRFEVGMSWENYGNRNDQWSVDHIVPCALFDLSKSAHQRRCFHFSNLQPMWHVENLEKWKHSDGQLHMI